MYITEIQKRIRNVSDNRNVYVGMGPVTAKIELTGVCTLNCEFCDHKNMKRAGVRQHFLSDEDFNIVLRYLANFPTLKEVGLFFMGESALHPKLPAYYKQLKELGYYTFLTTNGTTIHHVIPAIPYIDSLKVSWNYKNKIDFGKRFGKESLYDTIVKNIDILYDICHLHGKKLAVSTVLDTNKEDYASSLREIKYDEHYWIPLQNQGGSFEKGEPGVLGENDYRMSALPCWSLFKGLYIDCDLNVRTCCYSQNDDQVLGNLKAGSIGDTSAYERDQIAGKIPIICQHCFKLKEP